MLSFFNALKEILLFSLPIIAGQIGQMLFGIGDIIVAGHYSTTVLSALGISTAIFSPFLIIGLGITYVISPTKAKLMAEKKDVSAIPGTSLLLAVLNGIVLGVIVLLVSFNIKHIGLAPDIAILVGKYLNICAFSMIPALIFQVMKENLQAREKTMFANGLILVFNVFNVAANYIFMFKFDLGISGAALATTLCRSLMALVLYIYTYRLLKFKLTFDSTLFKDLYRTGLPVGFGGLVTGLVFSLVTVLCGKMSIVASATNNIILNVSSLTYMIPYALGSAASVKIGREYGEKNYIGIRNVALATTFIGFLVAGVIALLFYAIPEQILSVATSDQEVLEYGVVLLFYVALYQVPDSIQVIVMGCLRGLGITLRPVIYGFLGIWFIGLPVGCYFAYNKEMGAAGLWLGLAIGLTAMAGLFIFLFVKILNENSSKQRVYGVNDVVTSNAG